MYESIDLHNNIIQCCTQSKYVNTNRIADYLRLAKLLLKNESTSKEKREGEEQEPNSGKRDGMMSRKSEHHVSCMSHPVYWHGSYQV